MRVLTSNDSEVLSYGKIPNYDEFNHEDRKRIIDWMCARTQRPKTGDVYVADLMGFEELELNDKFYKLTDSKKLQFGYCHGHNQKVNALEWHDSFEVIFAITTCVLFLGLYSDMVIKDKKLIYNTENLVALKLKKGEMIMLSERVLHYAPVQENHSGFMTMIILPKHTNELLDKRIITSMKENDFIINHYLFMKNKWLLAHEESDNLIEIGAQIGIEGTNYDWSKVEKQEFL